MKINTIHRSCWKGSMYFAFLFTMPLAYSSEINSVTTGRNANGGYEIQLGGSELGDVRSYNLTNPSRIVVDIPNAKSTLAENVTKITHPEISNVAIIEGDDRVRATINMSKSLPYKLVNKPDRITVVVGVSQGSGVEAGGSKKASSNQSANVDFSRGADGQGKVQIKLPNDNTVVDVNRKGDRIVANIKGSAFSKTKRLNVVDFATPVRSIDVYHDSLVISAVDDNYEIVSYQSNGVYSIELNKLLKTETDDSKLLPGDSRKKYSGEPLSLNFQDIEVRAVLQLIGDFTNTNIVVSDAVAGGITLRLNDVPWDQALDIILQTKGLSMQENGGVIYIAPSADIAASKKAAYEVMNVETELAPLQQQLIQVQYARAENLEKIIEDRTKVNEGQTSGLLSSRGSITVDERTNTLIVNDVPSGIAKVQLLISELDVAVDQVLIDARIVAASNSFAHELGVRWGGAFTGATDNMALGVAGNMAGANRIISSAGKNIGTTGQAFPTSVPNLGDRLGVNLPSTKPTSSSIGLSLLGSDFILDLELSAMQDEGRGEVISSPRVIAQDGGTAEISQGTQIAFSSQDEDGKATTELVDVPLKLKVSPKIAPNQQVDMELEVTKNSPGSMYNGLQGIDTRSVKTQALVNNGETIVLGGVYEQTKMKTVNKFPVLGDLPVVGRAFKKDSNSVVKNELLIFVTPRIIDKRYTSRDKFKDIRQ